MTETNTMTITFNGKTTNINGLPPRQVRSWDDSINIKFYDRGKRTSPQITKRGILKAPRSETQLYVNGKYFIQFPFKLSEDSKDTVKRAFQYLYCYGCGLEEIQRIFKITYYK